MRRRRSRISVTGPWRILSYLQPAQEDDDAGVLLPKLLEGDLLLGGRIFDQVVGYHSRIHSSGTTYAQVNNQYSVGR